MNQENVKIWIWLHHGRPFKAVLNQDSGTLTVYDDHDHVLMKRKGLSLAFMKKVEHTLSLIGAKRIDENSQSFTYL